MWHDSTLVCSIQTDTCDQPVGSAEVLLLEQAPETNKEHQQKRKHHYTLSSNQSDVEERRAHNYYCKLDDVQGNEEQKATSGRVWEKLLALRSFWAPLKSAALL